MKKTKFRVGQRVEIATGRSVLSGKVYTVSRIEIDRLGVQYLIGGMWFNEHEIRKPAKNGDSR